MSTTALTHYVDLDLNYNELQKARIEEISTPTYVTGDEKRIIIEGVDDFQRSVDAPIKPFSYGHTDSTGAIRWEQLYRYHLNELREPYDEVNFHNQQLKEVAEGTDSTDGVNLSQVQGLISSMTAGLIPIGVVKCATTTNIATFPPTGLAIDIDNLGTSFLTAGDKVLVKDQTTATENGIWVASAGTWARDTRLDEDGEVFHGMLITDVENGDDNQGTSWYISSEGELGDSSHDLESGTPQDIEWSLFRSPLSLTGGNGIDITGTTISADLYNNTSALNKYGGLAFNGDKIVLETADDNPLYIGTDNKLFLNEWSTHLKFQNNYLMIDEGAITSSSPMEVTQTDNTSPFVINLKYNEGHFSLSNTAPTANNKLNLKIDKSKGLDVTESSAGSGFFVKVDGTTIDYDDDGYLMAISSSEEDTKTWNITWSSGTTTYTTDNDSTMFNGNINIQANAYKVTGSGATLALEKVQVGFKATATTLYAYIQNATSGDNFRIILEK